MPMGNGASYLDVEGLEDKILQALFGNTMFSGFTPLIKKFTNQALGIEGDALLDAVLYTNMTPTGVYMEQQSAMQRRMASRQVADLTRASRTQWFEAAAKTMMSYEAWEARNPGKTLEQYNEFMQNRAAGIADNGVVNTLLNMAGFDPDGINEAKTYLAKAGANISRHRRNVGDIGSLAASRAMRNVFMDAEGNLTYDKRDYGYMTMGETATVMAALTRDIDYFENLDVKGAGSFTDKIKAATEKIKQQAQEYTKALSPLKDVFGSDVPAMIQALEQASGQRFTQMSPEQMRDMTTRMLASADAGNYQLKQLAVVREQVSGAIEKMDVPIINDIAANAQSQMILGITNTGLIPSSMSAHRYEQLAADRVMRASNSRGATALAQAYAFWRERKEQEARMGDKPFKFASDDDAFAAFQEEYQQLRDNGISADRAILELSGRDNIYSLQEAAGSQYYANAVRRNLGGIIAMREARDQRIRDARESALNVSRENAVNFDSAIKALEDNFGLLNDDKALNAAIERGDIDAAVGWQIRDIRNGRYGDLGAVLSAYKTSVDVEAKTQKNIRLRNSIEALDAEFANDASGLIGRIIGVGRNGEGGLPTKESLREILNDTVSLRDADEDTMVAMVGSAAAATMLADWYGGTTDESKERYIKGLMKYGVKDGLANPQYMDALSRFYELYGDENAKPEDMRRALYDIELARNTSGDLLEQYKEAGKMGALYTSLEGGMAVEEAGDFIKGELLFGKMLEKAGKKDQNLAQSVASGGLREKIQAFMMDAGEATGDQVYEMLSMDKGGKQLIEELGEDTVKKLVNDQISKSDSPTRTQKDLFDMFDTLIQKFTSLETNLEQLINIYKPAPAGNANQGQGQGMPGSGNPEPQNP